MTRTVKNLCKAVALAWPLVAAPMAFAQAPAGREGPPTTMPDVPNAPGENPAAKPHKSSTGVPLDSTDRPEVPTDKANPNGSPLPPTEEHPTVPPATPKSIPPQP